MEEKKETETTGKTTGGGSRRLLLSFAFFVVFLFSFLFGYNMTVTQQSCGRAAGLGDIKNLLTGAANLATANNGHDRLDAILGMAGESFPATSFMSGGKLSVNFGNVSNSTTFNLPEFDPNEDNITDDIEQSICEPGQCTVYPTTIELCDFVGTAKLAVKAMLPGFQKKIKKVAKSWENWLSDSIDGTVYHTLKRLQVLELDMISWWDTMWFYNLRPSMQAMLEQLHTARATQALQESANADAAAVSEAMRDLEEDELDRIKVTEADENGCPVATVTGGAGRATVTGNAVREALQNESLYAGYNKRGTPGAGGRGAYLKHKSDVYEGVFCSPDSNAGGSGCSASGSANYPFFEADVQPSKFIFDKLTIPLDSTANSHPDMTDGEVYAQILQRGIENIVGSPSADVIPPSVVGTTPGAEIWMERRAHLARYAAARAIPQLLVGWRTPGAGKAVGEHVKEMRTLVGVADTDIAANPSYRELIHALTIDRFNSGTYALDQITDEVKVEQEKLRLATFTSILLRDYYELMERTALTLAVQVAVMAEQIPYPDVQKERNQRRQQ